MSNINTLVNQETNLGELVSLEDLGLGDLSAESYDEKEEGIDRSDVDMLVNIGFTQNDAERIQAMSMYEGKFNGVTTALEHLVSQPVQTKNDFKNDTSYLFLKGLTAFFHQRDI